MESDGKGENGKTREMGMEQRSSVEGGNVGKE